MLTNQEREFIRQAQVIEFNTDYNTFQEYVVRINEKNSLYALTDSEWDTLTYLSDKYGWSIHDTENFK